MSWQYGWGVEYFAKGVRKQKSFKFSEARARKFYERLKQNKEEAVLFRYRPMTKLDTLWEAKVTWLGMTATGRDFCFLVFATIAMMAIWRFAP